MGLLQMLNAIEKLAMDLLARGYFIRGGLVKGKLYHDDKMVFGEALAGLAVTPLPASAVIAGLRILDAEAGLARLPDVEFAIYEKSQPDKAPVALAAALSALAQGPSRPTI